MIESNSYGKELVLDIHECDVSKFTRESIEQFFIELLDLESIDTDVYFLTFESEFFYEQLGEIKILPFKTVSIAVINSVSESSLST